MSKQEKHEWDQRQLERDRAQAKSKRELAWAELKKGIDPRWVSLRYGFPLEVLVREQKKYFEAKAKAEAGKASTGG